MLLSWCVWLEQVSKICKFKVLTWENAFSDWVLDCFASMLMVTVLPKLTQTMSSCRKGYPVNGEVARDATAGVLILACSSMP